MTGERSVSFQLSNPPSQSCEKFKFFYPRGTSPAKANESLEKTLLSVMLGSPVKMDFFAVWHFLEFWGGFFFLKETFINFIKHGVMVAVLSESNHFMVVRWFLTITQDNKNTILLVFIPPYMTQTFWRQRAWRLWKGLRNQWWNLLFPGVLSKL